MESRTKFAERHQAHRDARLFLVGTEGEKTEPHYINCLKETGVIPRTKVFIEPIPTTDGASAPEHVFSRLMAAKKRYPMRDLDELWLVIDVDRWNSGGKLASVATMAAENGVKLAVSNPCFEVWLLFHFVDTIEATTSCKVVCGTLDEVRTKQGARGPTAFTLERVREATARARRGDPNPRQPWPHQPSVTHVYRLFENIFEAVRAA